MTTPVKIHRNKKNKAKFIGRSGIVISWTMIRTASALFNSQAPFPVVVVKLENGDKMMGQLVDFTDKNLKNGQPVEAVLRRTGIEDKESVINYSIKFRPV